MSTKNTRAGNAQSVPAPLTRQDQAVGRVAAAALHDVTAMTPAEYEDFTRAFARRLRRLRAKEAQP